MNEADFATEVYDLLRRFDWRWTHFRPGLTQKGWRTPLTGDPGFPDIIAVRASPPVVIPPKVQQAGHETESLSHYVTLPAPQARLLVIELKSTRGKLTQAEEEWLAYFKAAGVETYLWRPDDPGLEAMVEVLR